MKIAICEDNEIERVRCKEQIQRIMDKHQMEVEFELYESGEEYLFCMEDPKRPPDIIFLDIHMPGITGVELAHVLRQKGIKGEIIFYTISTEYYASAFDVRAFHYVVKGRIEEPKFEEILLRAVAESEKKNKEYIMCSGAGEYRNIEIQQIRYFQVERRIITVFYGENDSFSFYSTIGKVETRLQEYGFVRIHRSFLVAAFCISNINYQEVTLKSGERIPVGRSYYSDLKAYMDDYSSKNS